MVRLALSAVFLVVTGGGYSQNAVTFCDLVRNPDKYNGQEVRVRATYRYGFEWQELYCLDCKDKGKAWLEVPFDLDDAAIRPLRRAPKGAGIVNLTLQGVFVSGNHHFGHMGMYHLQVRCQQNHQCGSRLERRRNRSQVAGFGHVAVEKSRYHAI